MGSQPRSNVKRPAGRHRQLGRILQIVRELDRLDALDVYELAERHGTSTRTIWRDIDALEASGVALERLGEPGSRTKVRLAGREQLARAAGPFDVSHYLALRLAMGQGGAVRQVSSVFASLEDLASRLERAIGPKQRPTLRAIDAGFYAPEKFAYLHAPPDVLWPLVSAIAEHRLCSVTYRSPQRAVDEESAKFRVLPLRVVVHQGTLYLHAYVPKFDNVVLLHLHRLEKLRKLKEVGAAPKDYDPARWADAAFGVFTGGKPVRFRLRFSAELAYRVRERQWHPTQDVRELADGRAELTFSCDDSEEVRAWIASWRDGVEVVEPARVRKQLAAFGRWLTKRYRAASKAPVTRG